MTAAPGRRDNPPDGSQTSAWSVEATELLLRTVDGLSDRELEQPSGLTGWSRRHLLAHLACNAEALGRLAYWARTGVKTPMFASWEQRNADIEARSHETPARLREQPPRTAEGLAEDFADLPDHAWSTQVALPTGNTVPASELPWMRVREVNIHTIDLKAGITFADLSEQFHTALLDDVTQFRSTRSLEPTLLLSDGIHE
jgi:maleylpyruvate isomerase